MNLEDARARALEVMATNLSDEWTFAWDNAVQRLGACNFRKKTIMLSRKVTQASTVDQVMDTIRHEVAHAMVGLAAGHGRVWQLQAIRLGARPQASTSDSPNLRQELAPWIGTCPAGHVSEQRFWRKPRVNRACHKCCAGTYDPAHIITYRRVDVLASV